jgi:hypothetical protein
MSKLAAVFGVLVAAIGILGIVAPAALLEVARLAATPLGLYVAAAVRIVFGLVLMGAAASSRAPSALRILGALIVLAGIMTPLFGVERARAVIDFLSARGTAPLRGMASLALLFGLFVLHAVAPRGRTA